MIAFDGRRARSCWRDGCRAVNEAITGGSEPRGCSAGSAESWDSVVVSARTEAIFSCTEMPVKAGEQVCAPRPFP